ncbi:MAG TPA: hypothetical protein VGH21_06715, partial [Solirubrobacteraceae bacterium]
GKPDPGKSSAHVDQGARRSAAGHPAAGPANPAKGGDGPPAASSQGTAGTAGGGPAAAHGGPVPPPTTEDPPTGYVEAPSSAAPVAGAHEPQGEAAHGPPAHPAKG